MPRGPNGEKRPADAIGRAVMVGKIATGEMQESLSPPRHERARMGGQARMAALSGEERSEIGKRAAVARWNKQEASMTDLVCTNELAALYEGKVAAGLLDAKFLLRNVKETGTEEICQDVRAFYQAIQDGKAEPLDFGDLRWHEPE